NRAFNWVLTLLPIPAPGIITIAYMAQGNWYTLQDDGAGIITGSDPSFGSGTVDYTTGATVVTLGALPDAGSQIMYTWGSPIHFEQRTDTVPTAPRWQFAVTNLPILPATLTFSWLAGGVTNTATTNSAGVITGDATGSVDPVTGIGWLIFATLPDRGAQVTLNYEQVLPDDPGAPIESHSGQIEIFGWNSSVPKLTIAAGLDPSTIRMTFPVKDVSSLYQGSFSAAGSADGSITTLPGHLLNAGGNYRYDITPSVIGSYDSVTGDITFTDRLVLEGNLYSQEV
ncbi:MAG: hypothetical protein H7842_10680, partial [Gammaproteobacteria bacterium SHHR-1]